MQKTLLLFLLFSYTSITYSQVTLTTSQALNVAGKQSTICERLTKEKVFNTTTNSNSLLNQFKGNIANLKKVSFLNTATKIQLTNIEMIWYGFQENLKSKEANSFEKTLEFNNNISAQCKSVFDSILSYAKKNEKYPYNSSLENLATVYSSANNVKFLSQKLASHYAAYFTKKAIYNPQLFESIIERLDININELTLGQDESTNILTKTNTLITDWNALMGNLKIATSDKFTLVDNYPKPELISDFSNRLMKNSDLLLRAYKQTSETK